MSEFLLTNEPLLRLAAFAGVLLAMAGWELLVPRRTQEIGRTIRWSSNIGIVVLDTFSAVTRRRVDVHRPTFAAVPS